MGLGDSAQGYDCSGNTLHRHATTAVLVTFYSGLQQTQKASHLSTHFAGG
jgi:hypothetical protein